MADFTQTPEAYDLPERLTVDMHRRLLSAVASGDIRAKITLDKIRERQKAEADERRAAARAKGSGGKTLKQYMAEIRKAREAEEARRGIRPDGAA